MVAANGVEILHRCVQADGAGNVRRACLEFVGRMFPGTVLEIDTQNHFAAALIGRHRFEHFLPPV